MTSPSRPVRRTCALVGAGRAGTALAVALVETGWVVVSVAGRSPDTASVVTAATRFGAAAVDVDAAGRGAALVVLATPDGELPAVAARVAASLEPRALVVHLAGALGLEVLTPISDARPDVEVGALHPLQTLPSADTGAARLAGSWAAVAGPPSVGAVAVGLGLHPFTVDDEHRAGYHAAACMASNHLVALLGQVERVANAAGVPLAAFEPLVRATVDHCFTLGPERALTGPVARGDIATIARHLDAIAADEQRAYRAMADAAARLAGRDDDELRAVLS
jgi:predicted short-subunit dehydrogenase-like oxidoreductase (DUF2520 family)